jgi:integrase
MIDDRNWRTRSYYPTLERLGIERVSPHKARHTFATRGAKAGIPQTVLQNLLGHAKYDTTADYYTHVDILQLADGIELIDS